jgi:hypothetical protein
MTTLVLEHDPVATLVKFVAGQLVVELDDGRSLSIPLAWYPRLAQGTASERENWQLWGNGYAIEWPELDEHISVEGLIAGRPSGESVKSLETWLAARKSS